MEILGPVHPTPNNTTQIRRIRNSYMKLKFCFCPKKKAQQEAAAVSHIWPIWSVFFIRNLFYRGRKKVKWPEMTISNGVRGREEEAGNNPSFWRSSPITDSYFIQGLIPNKLWTHTHRTVCWKWIDWQATRNSEKNQKWKKRSKKTKTNPFTKTVHVRKKKETTPSLPLFNVKKQPIYIYIYTQKQKQKTKNKNYQKK